MSTEKETEEVKDQEEVKNEEKKTSKRGRRGKKDKSAEKIAELEAELSESKDKHLRLYAEFENFRKRTAKEKMELRATAARDTLSSLLPIMDDFDRAKASADDEKSEEHFTDGVTMIYNKFQSTLQAKGLKVMETNGEVFNPEFHEAITEIPAPSEEMKGKIIDTIEKGYMLNDKIIRYAKVVVGK